MCVERQESRRESTIEATAASERRPHPEADSLTLPEKSPVEWGIALSLFVLSVLYLWPFRSYTTLYADEGIVLQGAQRILQGQVLYRDFFAFYTPGSYYAYALLFKILGSSMLVARTVVLIYGGLLSVLTYLLARRVCSRWVSMLVVYLLLVTGLPSAFMVLHNWDSTVCALLALYCAIWLLQRPHWAWAIGTGSFAILTFLCEQSKGAGLMLGLLGGLVFVERLSHREILGRRNWIALSIGALGPLVVTVAYFALQGGLPQMLQDWLWPLQQYSGVNSLPYGYLPMHGELWSELYERSSWGLRLAFLLIISPYVVILILPFAAVGFLSWHGRKLRESEDQFGASGYFSLICAAISGLVLSAFMTGRPDAIHIMFIAPPLFLVLAWIIESRGIRSGLLSAVQPLLTVYLLISFTAFGLVFLLSAVRARDRLETRRGVLKTSRPDPVIPFIQEHVPSGGKILVYPYHPLLYFLTGTFSPTDFEYLQPGLHTPGQFRDALSRLVADRTDAVLYEMEYIPAIHGGSPATPLAVLADDRMERYFIFPRYRTCEVLKWSQGRLLYMVRNDLPCPTRERVE